MSFAVVIGYFKVVCVAVLPGETDAVLIVDANAVLPFAVSSQFF